jgi:hypothetical protein
MMAQFTNNDMQVQVTTDVETPPANEQQLIIRRVISMDALVRGRCNIPRSRNEDSSRFSRAASLEHRRSK